MEEESEFDGNVLPVTKAASAVTLEESVANGESKETPTLNGSTKSPSLSIEANGVAKVPPPLTSKGSKSGSLDAAKEQFLNLCKSLDPESNKQFMAWLADEALPYLKVSPIKNNVVKMTSEANAIILLSVGHCA